MVDVGDKVKWADESEVPSTTVLTVIRVGSFLSSNKSYDLVVESPSGNQFYVQCDEIVNLDGSPVTIALTSAEERRLTMPSNKKVTSKSLVSPDVELAQDTVGHEITSTQEMEQVLEQIAAEQAKMGEKAEKVAKPAKQHTVATKNKHVPPAKATKPTISKEVQTKQQAERNQRVIGDEKPAKKVDVKPAKPVVKSATVVLRAYQAGLDVTGWTSTELLEKATQLSVAFGQPADVLLWVKDQFAPAVHVDGNVWRLPWKGDATIDQPTYRAKVVISRAENIEVWQQSLGNKR